MIQVWSCDDMLPLHVFSYLFWCFYWVCSNFRQLEGAKSIKYQEVEIKALCHAFAIVTQFFNHKLMLPLPEQSCHDYIIVTRFGGVTKYKFEFKEAIVSRFWSSWHDFERPRPCLYKLSLFSDRGFWILGIWCTFFRAQDWRGGHSTKLIVNPLYVSGLQLILLFVIFIMSS